MIRDFSQGAGDRLARALLLRPAAGAGASTMFLAGGMPWLVWGFCLPTMTLAHATFAINTVNHMFGSRRFETVDESRNNPFTAFFAVGEGWHNNHHRYQRAARNGFYWWEFDLDLVRRSARWRPSAWCGTFSAVPKRIYEEARAVKAQRARAPRCRASSTPSPIAARARRRRDLAAAADPTFVATVCVRRRGRVLRP